VRLGSLGPRLARLAEDVDVQAKQQAARAQSIAENMQALTTHLDEATRELRRSSVDVERALGTVTRIAQHTRILAINASIEASRAGEHGRTFAIVVEEVQRLADGGGAGNAHVREPQLAAPAVRDRGPPVAAEGAWAELDARGRLAPLVLGPVDEHQHALDDLGIELRVELLA